jgi:hypothetical protein
MSRPVSADGTPYRPRQMAGGSPEMPLNKLKCRARGMLRSRAVPEREKDLIRAALTRIKETGTAAGQAAADSRAEEAGRLEGQRTEMISLLSLMLDQAEEAAARGPGALMTGRPRG